MVVLTDGACLPDESIFSFVQGQLPREAVPAVEEHLNHCADCRSVVAETAKYFSADSKGTNRPFSTAGDAGVGEALRPLPSGAQVSRYVISDVIGSGAAGVVYRAYDPELQRKIALKLLRTDHASDVEVAELKARLLREAQAMARLSHPNVVSVFDVGTYTDQVFIVMELVEGQTLARWLCERPRSWLEIRAVFTDAGRGLAAAHAVQLVHRDFKPANVLVGSDGRVRVTDFGLARPMAIEPAEEGREGERPLPKQVGGPSIAAHQFFTLTATEEGGLTGTPIFMAPEQFQRRRVDARTDQFSFCVALYMALYQRHPFLDGSNRPCSLDELATSVVRGRMSVPERPDVPRSILDILRRGLHSDPQERFSSMNDLLSALTTETAPLLVSPKPSRRGRWLLAIACALASGLVAAVMFAARSHPEPTRVPDVLARTATSLPVSATIDPVAPKAAEAPASTSTQQAAQPPTSTATTLPSPSLRNPEKRVRRPPPLPHRYDDRLKDPF
jgi:serine/threonine protein kinase